MSDSADARSRAVATGGSSSEAILAAVRALMAGKKIGGETVVELGCGRGDLINTLTDRFGEYIGVDVVRYDELPETVRFVEADLDSAPVPLGDGIAQLVVAVETIEHLENPRQFMREMTRLAAPGGWIVVTTPNQLSLASKVALVLKNEFVAFQHRPGLYPAHITALLPTDLVRIARECGLVEPSISYTARGRIPLTARSYPSLLSRASPQSFSDNVVLLARKPDQT